jgi:hypothetical protein
MAMSDLSAARFGFVVVRARASGWLAALLLLYVVTCCWSLVCVAEYFGYLKVGFDKAYLYPTMLRVAPFAAISGCFLFAGFGFGYFVGFYLYSMILGYLWIVGFSTFQYDHTLASISAFVSAVAFLIPALFVNSPIRQRFVLSERVFDNLLSAIVIFSAATIAVGAFYNFRLVGIEDIYKFREQVEFPAFLRYPIGMISSALLPFAFACHLMRGKSTPAAIAMVLLLLIYPITLTKTALLAPVWLLFLQVLSRFFEIRISVVLSLLLPIAAGMLAWILFRADLISQQRFIGYFGVVNFRMLAVPSVALDVYNDFFSKHGLTWFCQISFLKPFVSCPYADPLSVVMSNTYGMGFLNASLFATEGIASVGPMLAPLAALACGFVISVANRASSDLPPRLILLSAGILTQEFVNVPLATNLLSNGAALLFLLWYVTPRSIFADQSNSEPRGLGLTASHGSPDNRPCSCAP